MAAGGGFCGGGGSAPSALWLDRVRALAARARVSAAELDDTCEIPEADIAALHAAGLLTAPLPAEHGGASLATVPEMAPTLCTILRIVGAGSLPLGRLYEGHVNAVLLAATYGSPELLNVIAREAASGALMGVWNTDDADGLHLRGNSAGRYLLGRKILASGSGFIRRPLVTATDENGERLMAMPRLDDPGRADTSSWTPTGMRASMTGTIDFTGIVVQPHEIVGEDGDYHRQPLFSGGAWRFAAVQMGAVEALVDELRAHHLTTGRGEDAHQSTRLGQAAISAETGRLWVERAAVMATAPDADPEAVVAYVNLTRLAVERAALDVLELVQRSIGLKAFMRPSPVERIARDLATYLRQPAPDRALAEAAGWVLRSPCPMDMLWHARC